MNVAPTTSKTILNLRTSVSFEQLATHIGRRLPWFYYGFIFRQERLSGAGTSKKVSQFGSRGTFSF